MSLACAFVTTFVQQWSPNYLQMVQGHRSDPAAQAPLRLTVFRSFISHALGLAFLLLHISIFLVFPGIVDFPFPINYAAQSVISVSSSSSHAGTCISPSSLSSLKFPYPTPLSPLDCRPVRFPPRNISSLHCLDLTLFPLWTAHKLRHEHLVGCAG